MLVLLGQLFWFVAEHRDVYIEFLAFCAIGNAVVSDAIVVRLDWRLLRVGSSWARFQNAALDQLLLVNRLLVEFRDLDRTEHLVHFQIHGRLRLRSQLLGTLSFDDQFGNRLLNLNLRIVDRLKQL